MEEQGESENVATEPIEMEGQEAVLVEGVAEKSGGEEKKKNPKRRSFFRKSKGGDKGEAKGHLEQPSKTRVVLIPDESLKLLAAQKANQSRMLLEAALRPAAHTNGDVSEDKREQMIKAAFQFAAESRRLYEGDTYEDIESVVSQNTGKGEIAAVKALAIISARKTPTASEEGDGQDNEVDKQATEKKGTAAVPKENEWPARYTPQDIFDEAEKFAKRSRIHLETILPALECTPYEHQSVKDQPFVPTPGIVTNSQDAITLSTLGFDNTFQEPSFSITSLNEILDGPISPQASKLDSSDPKSNAESGGNNNDLNELPNGMPKEEKLMARKKRSVKHHKKKPASSLSKDEEKPMEVFVASVVEKEEEESVASDISNKSELERLRALETRTESKLKEAMEADETASVTSWNGVAMFQPPPEESPTRQKKGKKKGSEQKTATENPDELPKFGRAKQEKPQFVEATEKDPKVLASLAWDHLETSKETKEEEPELVPDPLQDATETKPKKRGLFAWGKKRRTKDDEELPVEDNEVGEQKEQIAADVDPTSAGKADAAVCENTVNTIQSKEDVGDRYTALSEDNDTFDLEAASRLKDKAPIVTPVDMMPDHPDPTDIRVVTSLDPEQRASDEADDVKFVEVEIGQDQVEKKIMTREAVMEKINMPRQTNELENGSTFEKVRTMPNQDGISQIEPSSSLIDEIEEMKTARKADNSKAGRRGKRLWRPFSFKAKRKVDKGEETENGDHPDAVLGKIKIWQESNLPEMTPANTGSLSESGLEAQA